MKRSEGESHNRGDVRDTGVSAVIAAAHELKSPLVLMRQLTYSASDEARTPLQRQQALDQLLLVADRSLRLTTDLTRTVRLEDSMYALEPVNAQQLCEAVVKQISPLYEQYGRVISFDTKRSLPPVLAHRELLTSVMYHFADNALHYGDGADSVRVSLQTKSSAGVLRMKVRDTGPSMSLSEWRRLRDKPSGTMTSRPQGSGLGLYIAEQFVGAMNGSMGLTRHRDGVTFFIDLPISEQLSLL